MERKLMSRTVWLIVLVALSVLLLVPSVVPSEQLPSWFARVFNRKIQLGLDLQGGLHLTYGVDLAKAVEDKATEIKRDLEAALAEQKVEARIITPPEPPGAVTIVAANAADLPKVESALVAYDEVVIKRTCPTTQTPDEQPRSLCVRVSSDYADGIKKSALDQAVLTIRERIDERGVAEPNVVPKGDEIIVELPGLDKETTQRVKDLIERTAKLEFKIVDENNAQMKKIYARAVEDAARHAGLDPKDEAAKDQVRERNLRTVEGVGVDIDGWTHDETGKQYTDYYLTAQDRTIRVPKAEATKRGCRIKDEIDGQVECTESGRQILEAYLAQIVAADPTLKVDDEHVIGYELVQRAQGEREADGSEAKAFWRTYYLARAVELAGSAVAQAQVQFDQQTMRPIVFVQFNRWGGRRFGELTGKAVGRKMAIILDDKVNSAPVIQAKLDQGSATITMGGTSDAQIQTEADDLVNVLKTGSLSAPLKIDKESEVGPLLGRDAIEKTKLSFLLGAVLVVVIMLWFYRKSAIIAIVALVINVTMMLAAMAALGATLTLPGIAALVLTLGMAVDANIVIFERARDELRLGKSVRGAVDAGFKRGFAAVLDGHLTTAAAGLVLYWYGSGPIKGFAVMLMIGIGTTLFTAVWCTRLFFDYWLRRNPSQLSI